MFERALAIWQAQLAEDHPYIPQVLHNLGVVRMHLGETAAAIAALERALELAGARSDDISKADTEFALARALWQEGRDLARARRVAEQARTRYLGHEERSVELASVGEWLRTRNSSVRRR